MIPQYLLDKFLRLQKLEVITLTAALLLLPSALGCGWPPRFSLLSTAGESVSYRNLIKMKFFVSWRERNTNSFLTLMKIYQIFIGMQEHNHISEKKIVNVLYLFTYYYSMFKISSLQTSYENLLGLLCISLLRAPHSFYKFMGWTQ